MQCIGWLTKEHEHPYLASIVSVKSRRFHNNEWSQETRYFISSVKHNDAEKFGHYVRSHWGVENNLHWTLDMAFDEDSCRIRKGFADQNMAILHHISLNLLKSETDHNVQLGNNPDEVGLYSVSKYIDVKSYYHRI